MNGLAVDAVGLVPTSGRGRLPATLLHGQPLAALAATSLREAGVELVEPVISWSSLQERGRVVVLHDPLCPLTPADFVVAGVREASASGAVVVGVRPVTDTVKAVRSGLVGDTVDRASLWLVTSPVVLPPGVVGALSGWPETDDFASLVDTLRVRFAVTFLEAPVLARRVEDESAVVLLEVLHEQST